MTGSRSSAERVATSLRTCRRPSEGQPEARLVRLDRARRGVVDDEHEPPARRNALGHPRRQDQRWQSQGVSRPGRTSRGRPGANSGRRVPGRLEGRPCSDGRPRGSPAGSPPRDPAVAPEAGIDLELLVVDDLPEPVRGTARAGSATTRSGPGIDQPVDASCASAGSGPSPSTQPPSTQAASAARSQRRTASGRWRTARRAGRRARGASCRRPWRRGLPPTSVLPVDSFPARTARPARRNGRPSSAGGESRQPRRGRWKWRTATGRPSRALRAGSDSQRPGLREPRQDRRAGRRRAPRPGRVALETGAGNRSQTGRRSARGSGSRLERRARPPRVFGSPRGDSRPSPSRGRWEI